MSELDKKALDKSITGDFGEDFVRDMESREAPEEPLSVVVVVLTFTQIQWKPFDLTKTDLSFIDRIKEMLRKLRHKSIKIEVEDGPHRGRPKLPTSRPKCIIIDDIEGE